MLSEHEIRLQLQRALDDPQWPQHAEVSKELLRGLAGLLHQLQAQAIVAALSQPSSVAMTDDPLSDQLREYASNPGYSHNDYADVMRAAAIEIDRLNALQSSPKGASTGTDWSGAAKWLRNNYQDHANISDLCDAMLAASPQEASKPQDVEECRISQLAGISTAAMGYWKEGDGIHPEYDSVALRDVAKLYAKYVAASQPSAASGRELPPVAWMTGDPNLLVRNQANTMFTVSRTQLYANDIPLYAALTGAAPADANVGDWVVRERHDESGNLRDCFVEAPREGDMAYGLEVLGDDYTGYGDVERKLEHCKLIVQLYNARSTTAPEPSAPADKVADMYVEIVIDDKHGCAKMQYAADGGFGGGRTLGKYACYWISHNDDDAAIDRMRSEDGKGGKL